MDMPYGDVDRIAKLIPATVGMTIDKALEDVPDLRKIYDSEAQVRELIDTAKKLEGLVRGVGRARVGGGHCAARRSPNWCPSPGPRTTKSSPPMT